MKMMSGPVLLTTAAAALCMFRPIATQAFTRGTALIRLASINTAKPGLRNQQRFVGGYASQIPVSFATKTLLRSITTSDDVSVVDNNVSRISTLQALLSKHGAPGSSGCAKPNGDLIAVQSAQETPELVSSIGGGWDPELCNLHPYLYPIAKSQSTDHYICAYRNPFQDADNKQDHRPWPIVETTLNGPGMELLALNSEHMMRRIVSQCDFDPEHKDSDDTIRLYNEGLGKGLLADAALDTPYEAGSVEKLGYGVDKYVLLRVGPFPDLYGRMSQQHADKGDEQSSLIACEAANNKLAGFGSTFRFYAQTLSKFPGREEEARDAARMCLRLPLPTIGLSYDDFKEVAVLGQIAEESDSTDVALQKLKDLYEKMREAESEQESDPFNQQGRTPEEAAIEEANHVLNMAVLEGNTEWSKLRPELAKRFREIGRDDMATFVDIAAVLQ